MSDSVGQVVARPVQLAAANLPLLTTVPTPGYDRAAVDVGIVHLGVGGFHRAHQAMYVDRLLEAGSRRWGICGVGVLPGDRAMRDVLAAQDGLYTLVLKHPDGTLEPRVIGSIIEYLHAPENPEAVLERMTAASTRIVSLTITEGGYHVDPFTEHFDAEAARTPPGLPVADPLTTFSLVTEALVRRRERGVPPFVVLSCDNVQRNGDVARIAFSSAAEQREPGLGAWVRHHVHFPNSMVDRITPGTTDEDRRTLEERFGVRDGWPVVAEPFVQWVIQDAFGDDEADHDDEAARPPLEQVGAQIVDDVDHYEQMKLRLLNAGHQSIGYLGYLAGHRYTDEVLADPLFRAFLSGYLWDEALPAVPSVPGIDLDAYAHELLERFGNPFVRDTLLRICTDGSDRIRTFLLPVVRERLAQREDVSHAVLVVAAWARFLEGVDEQGDPIPVVDRRLEKIRRAVLQQRDDPRAVVTETGLFGDLAINDEFVSGVVSALEQLHAHGARATLTRLVQPEP